MADRDADGSKKERTLRVRHAIFIEGSSIETEFAGTLAKGPYSSRNSRARCARALNLTDD